MTMLPYFEIVYIAFFSLLLIIAYYYPNKNKGNNIKIYFLYLVLGIVLSCCGLLIACFFKGSCYEILILEDIHRTVGFGKVYLLGLSLLVSFIIISCINVFVSVLNKIMKH
jgi:hypothetical protein